MKLKSLAAMILAAGLATATVTAQTTTTNAEAAQKAKTSKCCSEKKSSCSEKKSSCSEKKGAVLAPIKKVHALTKKALIKTALLKKKVAKNLAAQAKNHNRRDEQYKKGGSAIKSLLFLYILNSIA